MRFERNESALLVQIGMPVFNGEATIERAIDSIRNQTYPNFHLTISDNASTDNTERICRQLAKEDERISYFRNELNRGPTENFSSLLDEVDSPVFMWASDDDFWEDTFIEQGVSAISSGYDYFSANWWVGNLDTNTGASLEFHLLGNLLPLNPERRLLEFLNLHHASHKCNLVYSVFATEFLKSMYSMQDIADDGTLSACIVYYGNGAVVDEVLFRKHHVSGASMKFSIRDWNHLLERLRYAKNEKIFNKAKQKSLRKLTDLFPANSESITKIYNNYHLLPPQDFKILDTLSK